MKRLLAITASTLMLSARAFAQAPATSAAAQPETSYYVNGLIAASLTDVQSQAFAVEVGVKVARQVDAFIEVGGIRDRAPTALGESAQLIAQYVAQSQPGLVYQVKQPVAVVQAGVRYNLAKERGPYMPYVVVGGGMARLTRDVTFSVGRNEITDQLGQYGVALGSDLAGSVSKGIVTVGGGVEWMRFQPFSIGIDYRYGRIFDTVALSVNRAGISIGVKF